MAVKPLYDISRRRRVVTGSPDVVFLTLEESSYPIVAIRTLRYRPDCRYFKIPLLFSYSKEPLIYTFLLLYLIRYVLRSHSTIIAPFLPVNLTVLFPIVSLYAFNSTIRV